MPISKPPAAKLALLLLPAMLPVLQPQRPGAMLPKGCCALR
jgi:hypothetical protein